MRSAALLCAAALFPATLAAQTAFPQATARAYLESTAPAPAAEASLRRLAASADPRQRALAEFVLGTGESARGELDPAAADLALAAARPPLRDPAAAALVALDFRRPDPAATLAAAAAFPVDPASPFYPQFAMDAARSAETLLRWTDIQTWTASLPPTAPVIWLQAEAADHLGQTRAAAEGYRNLEYRFPASPEAAEAAPGRQRLAAAFTDLAPTAALIEQQAAAWSRAGHPRQAAASWALAATMSEPAQQPRLAAEQARAWLAAGDLPASAALAAALLDTPERPQALELQIELARAAKPVPASPDAAAIAIDPILAQLRASGPASPWYARGLHEAGDEALLRADATRAQTDFDALTQTFPDSAYAPAAMWQAAWVAYRLAQPGTPQRLEAYLRAHPKGDATPDALFWRGRWAEDHAQPTLAQWYFRTAARRFPGAYFGLQARARVTAKKLAGPAPEPLRPYLQLPPAPHAAPLPAASPQLALARMLQQAWLLDPAAEILNAAMQAQPPGTPSLALARRLAALERQRPAADREAAYAALAAMARAVPNYLQLAPAQLPASDWNALFPRPFLADIAAVAARDDVPQSLLLGLIRQESAFDPQSLSPARARGLMQLELATARIHFAHLPPRWKSLAPPGPLENPSLFIPALNVALGSAELRTLLDRFHDPAYALAGYDAGTSRVLLWQTLFPGLGINEFIESIPFGETRGYVQAVLRNQAHYQAARARPALDNP